MNVSLTPELEQFISHKVDSGLYNSASEVMRHALRLLVEREAAKAARLAHLRGLIQEAEQEGGWQEWDLEAFLSGMKAGR